MDDLLTDLSISLPFLTSESGNKFCITKTFGDTIFKKLSTA